MAVRPKVSVVMPVYNAGNRLVRCLDSVTRQTLHDIEIILVLDCPTDGSDAVAKRYAGQDSRIRIVENTARLHIGESRNVGMRLAKGEYIHFSDHDDYHEPAMLERMYRQATAGDLDLLVSAPVAVENGRTVHYGESDPVRDRQAVLQHLLGGEYDGRHTWSYYCYIHNVLYRTAFLRQYDIRFVDTRQMTPEDYIFNAVCLLHAGRVKETKDRFYYHELFSASEGHHPDYYSGMKRAKGLAYLYDYLHTHTADTALWQRYDLYLARNYILLLIRALQGNRSLRECLRLMRCYRRLPFSAAVFRHYRPSVRTDYQGLGKQCLLSCLITCLTFGR